MRCGTVVLVGLIGLDNGAPEVAQPVFQD
ncbi:MAG: hypothetical protein ACI9YT_000543 [Halobacteriales archaeon]